MNRTNKIIVGKPRQKEILKEKVLLQVEEMFLRDMSQNAIAKELKVTQPMVCKYRKELIRRYVERQEATRDEGVALLVAKLEKVREEAWKAYYRSMEDAESVTEELMAMKEDEEEAHKAKTKKGGNRLFGESLKLLKKIVKRQGRLPASEYLRIVMDTLQAEAKLRGWTQEVNVAMVSIAPNWEPEEDHSPVVDVETVEVKRIEDKGGA